MAGGVAQELGLHLAKGGLPLLREDLPHRRSHPFLDLLVQVHERHSQARGQAPAHGRLARAHEPRQVDAHGLLPPAAASKRRQLAPMSPTSPMPPPSPRQTAPSTATASAPAASTAATLPASMPPMATSRFAVRARACCTKSRPTPGSGRSLPV